MGGGSGELRLLNFQFIILYALLANNENRLSIQPKNLEKQNRTQRKYKSTVKLELDSFTHNFTIICKEQRAQFIFKIFHRTEKYRNKKRGRLCSLDLLTSHCHPVTQTYDNRCQSFMFSIIPFTVVYFFYRG